MVFCSVERAEFTCACAWSIAELTACWAVATAAVAESVAELSAVWAWPRAMFGASRAALATEKALPALAWTASRAPLTLVKAWPMALEAVVKAAVTSAWLPTWVIVEPRADWAAVDADDTWDSALATMPWTWPWALLTELVSWALSWSMLVRALLVMPVTASLLAQVVESATAECDSAHAGVLLLDDSMATVLTPAALMAPIPRARAQRGMTSNMVVALPFVLASPRSDTALRRCSSPLSGRCDECFG